MTSRRDFLLTLAAGALLPAASRSANASPFLTNSSGRALSGVGVQLYMLRSEMRANPESTLARIAELGYDEIEWWGSWERTPTQLKAALDSHGLRTPAAHIDPKDLTSERLPALLDTAGTMGHKILIVAWTAPEQRRNEDDWKRVANMLNEAGASAASSGIKTGYHNHDFEFQRFGNRTGLEILIAETDPRYVDIELDCFWALKAGYAPQVLLRQHRDRISLLHLKDSSGPPQHEQRDIGSGVIDWKPLLASGISQRVQHIYVEQDNPADAWESAKAGRDHLRSIGY